VIGQFGGNSWCALHPMMVEGANGKFQAQTVMIITKVIEAAGDIHTRHQGFGTARQCACSSHQVVEPQAKCGIETFDESRVDYAFAILSSFDQVFDHFLAALHNTPVNGQNTFNALFDNLHNGDVWPGNHLATTDFASPAWYFTSKSHPKSSDVTCQTIGCQ